MKNLPQLNIQLPSDQRDLWNLLKKLCYSIRKYRFKRWKRCDPFIETLFDRKEKAEFLGFHNVVIHDSTVVTGNVKIGERTFVGPQCNLDGSGSLTIGKNCSIAVGTRIFSHDSVKWAVSGGKCPIERTPTIINDHCFIGANSIILKGVEIGQCSVVAAGSIVNKNIQPYTIVAGNPAQAIGSVQVNKNNVNFKYTTPFNY